MKMESIILKLLMPQMVELKKVSVVSTYNNLL